MQRLLDAGYPEGEMFHHATDLYVYDTPLVRGVVRRYCAEKGWDKLAEAMYRHYIDELVLKTFTDNVTGKKMLDLAFQYNGKADE